MNGVALDVPVIRYSDILRGGTLRFVMGPKPSRWGAGWKPASIREEMKAGKPQ